MKKLIFVTSLILGSIAKASEPPRLGHHGKIFSEYAGEYFEKIQQFLKKEGAE